ncbi:MAG TPA: hypothetical protein PLY93_12505, partial [Turneriella sp.]|nr:hypothetical protein [Turneriella sp.]
MADSIKTSISDSAKAFLLSDREGEFQGENFERAFIRYYLALNQVLQGDLAAAKRTLRKLDADLKDMKYDDVAYKQILIARYLDALVSEELKEYNDARVQYKNLENFGVDTAWLNRERYTLAARAKDRADMAKYVSFKPDTLLPSSEDPTSEKIGELVLICETGKAAVKESRGKLLTDEQFMIPLRISIDIAVLSDGKGMSTAGIIAMMGTAENPIPRFVERDALPLPSIQIGGAAIPGFRELTNFDNMAQKNFNDNYSSYINKNVASIATKIVLAAVAAEAVSSAIRKNTNDNLIGALGGLAVGIGAGAGVAATVKPDLRSWHTLPTGFSATRLFLPAGKYPLQVDGDGEAVIVYGKPALEVEIQPH